MQRSEQTKSRISPLLLAIFKPIHWLFMRLYFRVTVTGVEQIPIEGPVILAPTHRTRWDTFMLYHALRKAPKLRLLRFLTSHDEATEGFQGWVVSRFGGFPINTKRPSPSALKHCGEILLEGQVLVIFPEGDIFRIPPGEIHPIKPGLAWIALKVQEELGETPLSIIPVRLNFEHRFLKFRSRAEVEFRTPIPVSNYKNRPDLTTKEAIRTLTADVQAELGEVVNPASRTVVDAIARGETVAGTPQESEKPHDPNAHVAPPVRAG